MPGCSLLLILLAWRRQIFVSDHHQGSEQSVFFKEFKQLRPGPFDEAHV